MLCNRHPQRLTLTTWTQWYPFLFWCLHSPISYFNLASRSPPPGFDHKTATHLISYSISYVQLLDVGIGTDTNVTNPWVELTLENRLGRRGCLRAYKHMVKLILNPCRTLKIITRELYTNHVLLPQAMKDHTKTTAV